MRGRERRLASDGRRRGRAAREAARGGSAQHADGREAWLRLELRQAEPRGADKAVAFTAGPRHGICMGDAGTANPAKYRATGLLSQSAGAGIYRAVRLEDNRAVIIKT